MKTVSMLATDGYKFSMAEAGAALRQETFVYSHRRGGFGGWHYMPVDVATVVKAGMPSPARAVEESEYSYLSHHRYMGGAFQQAIKMEDKIRVSSVPKGSWFYNREPAFTVSGPSALASWPEPSLLQLHYRIQLATRALTDPEFLKGPMTLTCEEEREIVLETLDSIHVTPPALTVESDRYQADVLGRARGLVEAVGNPNRIFEVGMRSVSCMGQHRLALQAIREAGIVRTSNVLLARDLEMTPVGTMGHEHVQRFDSSYEAFIAMRDRVPGFIFYLPDTFNTLNEGVPAAISAMKGDPSRASGIRFDSEDGIRIHYLITVLALRQAGLTDKVLALESGWNLDLTLEFEKLRESVRWSADCQAYGYGDYLVRPSWDHLSRDGVAANYKLSESNGPRMKFGDEPNGGKESIPGKPLVWRSHSPEGPVGYVLQEGEDWKPQAASRLSDNPASLPVCNHSRPPVREGGGPVYSPATLAARQSCEAKRERAISERALTKGY